MKNKNRIRMNENFSVAFKVLAKINQINIPENILKHLWVEAYSNGREQGLHIKGYFVGNSIGISFSEYRNSDSIVVYVGNSYSFSMQGNVPSDEIWKNAKYFKPNEYREAAKYIFEEIKERANKKELVKV